MTEIISKNEEYLNFRKQFGILFEDDNSQVRVELDRLGKKVEFFLEKQFPDGAKVKFEVIPPKFEELLKNFNSNIDDGVLTSVEDKGDGMQRALMLAIIQAYAEYRKNNASARDFLFLIDEAELHLHPSAQRALKNALIDIIVDNDQVLINTHSSVLVADEHEKQKIFVAKKTKGVTEIAPIREEEKPSIVFDLLGGSPTDLLFPANIIIVEGYSEVIFMRNIIQRFYSDLYSKIQVIPANGDITKQEKSITVVNSAYECFKSPLNPYSEKIIVLVDKPNSTNEPKYEEFKTTHAEILSSGRYFELPQYSLEEYYPGSHKADPNSIAGRVGGKNHYAEEVGKAISKDEFQSGMKILYEALEKARVLSFGTI